MSAPRLTFLYPFLFSPAKPATARWASRAAKRTYTSSSRKRQSPAHQRYGTANEPAPHLNLSNSKQQQQQPRDGLPKDAKDSVQPRSELQKVKAQEAPSKNGTRDAKSAATHAPEDGKAIEALPPPPTSRLPPTSIMDSAPLAGPSPQPQINARPLESVLNMPAPDPATASVYEDTALASDPYLAEQEPRPETTTKGETRTSQPEDQPLEQQRPPHISTPPYVHHFDTYGLVRRLEEGGWTQAQAVTLMKAVRLTLSSNMDLAHHGLVSKSNVENESYLFSAACSELKTEIQTKRKAEGERSRSDRTQLQHEVDILSQRMNQESATLKDELKGMFDDRKMAVRNEQRTMESKVQELNYRITVALNSDSRSDVEGVRWIITKRAITALAICVGLILGSIKFASSVAQWEEEEKKRLHAARKKNYTSSGTNPDDRDNSPKASRDESGGFLGRDEMGHGEILVQHGDNPAFVSLG